MIVLHFLCFHFISKDKLEISSFTLLFENVFVTVGTQQLIHKCAFFSGLDVCILTGAFQMKQENFLRISQRHC
jgi:hypothetical protein